MLVQKDHIVWDSSGVNVQQSSFAWQSAFQATKTENAQLNLSCILGYCLVSG